MKQLLIRMKNNFTDNRNEMIRTLLLSEGFGFCFSLSCICGYRLDKYDTLFSGAGQVISGLLLALLAGIPIALLFCLVDSFVKKSTDTETANNVNSDLATETADKEDKAGAAVTKINPKHRLLCTLLLLICWLPVYLAYFPAVFSYDGEAQLYQVISSNYSTHHPLIHTLLLGACMKLGFSDNGINAGMALYAGIQMLSMALMMGWAMAEMLRIGIKRAWFTVYAVFMCLFPVHAILAVSTTKDVLFSGFVVIYVFLVRRLWTEGRSDRVSLLKIVLTMTVALLFRNNAQYALAAMLVVLVFVWLFGKKKKKSDENGKLGRYIFVSVLSLVLAMLIGAGMKVMLKAESGSPREALAIPIQQMARVKNLHGNELEEPLKSDLEQLISSEWADRYDEHLADPIKERISMKQPALFVKTWVKLGFKYPADYIDAWLLTTEGAWYIRDKSCNRIYGEGRITGFGYLSTDIRNMPEGFEVRDASIIPGLRFFLEGVVSDNNFEKVPVIRLIFSPALYIWILFAYVCLMIIKRDGRGLMVNLFAFMYFLTLLLSPAILVRYMYPYMLLVILPALDFKMTGKKERI